MHGKFFSDEEAVKKLLQELGGKKKAVVVPKGNGLELYGDPTWISHDIDCLYAGAKSRNLNPFVVEL